MSRVIEGDYVLAMKWYDGDPKDPWAVGFVSTIEATPAGRRFIVTDGDGKSFRASGYRRVARITPARGKWLLENSEIIEASSYGLAHWLRARMPAPKEKPAT